MSNLQSVAFGFRLLACRDAAEAPGRPRQQDLTGMGSLKSTSAGRLQRPCDFFLLAFLPVSLRVGV